MVAPRCPKCQNGYFTDTEKSLGLAGNVVLIVCKACGTVVGVVPANR